MRFPENAGGSAIQTQHILPLILGGDGRAQRWSAALRERGLHVPAIRPPTVPEGQARLRISLSAAHSREQLELLVTTLEELVQGE